MEQGLTVVAYGCDVSLFAPPNFFDDCNMNLYPTTADSPFCYKKSKTSDFDSETFQFWLAGRLYPKRPLEWMRGLVFYWENDRCDNVAHTNILGFWLVNRSWWTLPFGGAYGYNIWWHVQSFVPLYTTNGCCFVGKMSCAFVPFGVFTSTAGMRDRGRKKTSTTFCVHLVDATCQNRSNWKYRQCYKLVVTAVDKHGTELSLRWRQFGLSYTVRQQMPGYARFWAHCRKLP